MLVINKVPYYLSNGIIAEFKKDLEARDDHRTLLSDCLKEMDELKADILDHQPCNAPSLPWYAEYNRAEEYSTFCRTTTRNLPLVHFPIPETTVASIK